MAGQHAVATGNITGRIPYKGGKDGFIDVTSDYVFVDSVEEAQAVAEAIELEHAARHTHPVQLECEFLGHLNETMQSNKTEGRREAVMLGVHEPEAVLERHQAEHKALNEKAGL
jgi:hypothetical protein